MTAPRDDDAERAADEYLRQARAEAGQPEPGDDPWAGMNATPGRPPLRAVPAADDEDQAEAELPEAPPFPARLAKGPLRAFLDWADADGLPVSYAAAAAETAAAAAMARTRDGEPGAVLRLTATRTVIPSLWQALIGDSGDGKNPPIRLATEQTRDEQAARLADWEAECQLATEGGKDEPPRPPALMLTSATMEATCRWLAGTGGAGLVTNGELASFLRGLGQYKAGGGSDRYDAMDIWSGEAVTIERVGDGGQRNGVRIHVPSPRLSVVGGLVIENLAMLGNESDGLRARFLPVLPSSQVRPNLDGSAPLPPSWCRSMTALHQADRAREWVVTGEAREIVKAAITRWTDRRRNGTDPKVIRTALAKADEQCLRLALVAAEIQAPGRGGDVPVWAVRYAIARVEYALGVWLALGSDQVMSFSRRDDVLNTAVRDLLNRIQRRDPGDVGRRYMTRRDIQMARVGGVSSPAQTDELIRAWLAQFPLCVTVYSEKDRGKYPGARLADRADCPEPATRGPAPVIVWEPRRTRLEALPDPQRADGKLLNSTVSRLPTGAQRPDIDAGHSDMADPADPRKLLKTPPRNSFPATVSSPDADPGDWPPDPSPWGDSWGPGTVGEAAQQSPADPPVRDPENGE